MIFVTIGTHHEQFDRLIRRIDEIAPKIKEKIIVQTGFTKYKPKNVEFFEFADNIGEYFDKARLIITQPTTSLVELTLKHNKPVIAVPRRKKYREHLNDHQVEFAEYFAAKTGISYIMEMRDLTPEFLKNYDKKANIKKDGLIKLQKYVIRILEEHEK